MSIEKLVEQDFQALETSFSKEEPLDEVALARILEQIQLIGDADRIAHWHDELRRIRGLPSSIEMRDGEGALLASIPVIDATNGVNGVLENYSAPETEVGQDAAADNISGGDGSLST